MDLVFKGFQSPLPVWIFLIIFAGLATLAWWAYKDVKIAASFKTLLITLRSLIFFILLLVLASPFLTRRTTTLKKPEVLVFMDNSASTAIRKGTYGGSDTYHKILDQLAFKNSPEVNLSFFLVDDSLTLSSPDSLNLQGNRTNLFNIITAIQKNKTASSAIVLSDGIFNTGRNPLYESSNLEVPIQTIALGDTSQQKDVLIKNVAANSTGYLHTSQDIKVDLAQYRFPGSSVSVQLKKGKKVLQSKRLSFTHTSSSKTLTFKLMHTQKGLQQYQITIPALEGEWTAKNNSRLFSVNVLDNQKRILSLAFEIHPDVRYIRSLLAGDKNTILTARTWLHGNRFIEEPLSQLPDSLNLIILQGYPNNGVGASVKNKLASLIKKTPLMVMATPKFSYKKFKTDFDISLPITSSGTVHLNEVEPLPSVGHTDHPVMDLPEVNPAQLPSLYAPIQKLKLNPGSTMLLESQFQGRATAMPLLAVQQIGNVRRAQLTGYNWFKMELSTDENTRKFVRQLLLNTISWTSTSPDTRKLKIKPARQTFEGNEAVVFNGFLVDERNEKESDALIKVQISGGDTESKSYSMESQGEGEYRLNIGALPKGTYHFKATAKKGDRSIDTQTGAFNVAQSNVEFINTQRNDELLHGLAKNTGGTYYSANTVESLWEDMQKKGLLKKEEKVEETFFYPYQHVFWFIIVIVLLGAEWLVRKYVALP